MAAVTPVIAEFRLRLYTTQELMLIEQFYKRLNKELECDAILNKKGNCKSCLYQHLCADIQTFFEVEGNVYFNLAVKRLVEGGLSYPEARRKVLNIIDKP